MHLSGMKLLDGGKVPNARRVRVFLAEKGITLPIQPVDLGQMEHKSDAFRAANPLMRVPVLVLDDGTAISESIAICRYIEELHPEPPLFGTQARERAEVEMWLRRVEFELYLPLQAVFRQLHPAMAAYEVPQVPEWGEANKPRVIAGLRLLDEKLRQSPFLAGDRFSMADIAGFITVDFMKPTRLLVPEELVHLGRWHRECAARPSAGA